jgi:hypothetical protein
MECKVVCDDRRDRLQRTVAHKQYIIDVTSGCGMNGEQSGRVADGACGVMLGITAFTGGSQNTTRRDFYICVFL